MVLLDLVLWRASAAELALHARGTRPIGPEPLRNGGRRQPRTYYVGRGVVVRPPVALPVAVGAHPAKGGVDATRHEEPVLLVGLRWVRPGGGGKGGRGVETVGETQCKIASLRCRPRPSLPPVVACNNTRERLGWCQSVEQLPLTASVVSGRRPSSHPSHWIRSGAFEVEQCCDGGRKGAEPCRRAGGVGPRGAGE